MEICDGKETARDPIVGDERDPQHARLVDCQEMMHSPLDEQSFGQWSGKEQSSPHQPG